MTLNQAELLEEALTGYNRNLIELQGKKSQTSTLAVDPTASKEVPRPPSAFDFIMLLDISDNSSLNRMNDIMGKLDTFLKMSFYVIQSSLFFFEMVNIPIHNCKWIIKNPFQTSKELPNTAQLPPALSVFSTLAQT